ncbi:DUF2911 domain-containing protein [Capnocytophaga sp. ARDL2]|uniref:DUF2911 domain-containing protein n=1 Tax=Capnocytophaga sp. ARDL2 TaxID=3238809 RepID=UPI003556F669
MKKIAITICALVVTTFANAQVVTPKASPSAEVEQVVGLTKVEVNYSRPATKGRSVFGDLVPYGRLWRTGANENTVVEFTDDVQIDGKVLEKGKYAIYTVPSPTRWEVVFYKDFNNWGLPKEYSEEKIALTTVANSEMLDTNEEFFTIEVTPITTDKGDLVMSWEKTRVRIPFEVPTHKKTMESIALLNEESKASDFYAAGQYLYSINQENEKALEYVNKSIEMQNDAPFYMLRTKSLIQHRLGDKQGAIETAKLSLEKAEQANNLDYIKMNRDSLLEWMKS